MTIPPRWLVRLMIWLHVWCDVRAVHVAAGSEDAAKAKALALWESERAKLYKPAAPETNRDASKPVGGGRGSHFIGKAWLINSATREKIRVPVEEVGSYLSQGWERGGPRSK